MKCSFCKEEAKVKCTCKDTYMCSECLVNHIEQKGSHAFEKFVLVPSESPKIKNLRSGLMSKLKQLESSKSQIISSTSSLISLISNLGSQAIKKLDDISKVYHDILSRKHYFESDLFEFTETEGKKLTIQSIETSNIKTEIEKNYSKDFIELIDKWQYKKSRFLDQNIGGLRCGVIIDGENTLVTGGSDSAIRVWNLHNKQQLFVLLGHSSDVLCLTSVQNFRQIISGSFDASIRIWSLAENKQVAVFREHQHPVHSISYVSQKNFFISGDRGGILIIWNFRTRKIVSKYDMNSEIFTSVLMTNQHTLVLGMKQYVIFFDIGSGTINKSIEAHKSRVWSMCLDRRENLMVTGSDDSLMIVWDLKVYQKIMLLEGHTGCINFLALDKNEFFIISGSDDYTIRVWSMNSYKEVNKYEGHNHHIFSILRFDNYLVSLSQDSGIGFLDLNKNKFDVQWLKRPYESDLMNFTTKFNLVGFGSRSDAFLWDLDKEVAYNIANFKNQVRCVEFFGNCSWVAIGLNGLSENFFLVDFKNNKKFELVGHSNSVFCACVSSDKQKIASGSGDKTVRFWNFKDCKLLYTFKGHVGHVYSIKFIDSKNFLVSAGEDAKVIIWNYREKNQFGVLAGHKYPIWKVIVTDNENFIISGDSIEGIRIWNVNRKEQIFLFGTQEEASKWLRENKIHLESVAQFLKE